MENELVFIKKYQKQEVVFTNSLKVSKGSGIHHDKIKISIKKYEEKIKELGILHTSYERSSKGARSHIVYNLNEQQSSFLITLLKNTDTVVQFKMDLVKEFSRMREFIEHKHSTEYIEARQESKDLDKELKKVIELFVDHAISQGSTNYKRYYSNFCKLVNSTIGIKSKQKDHITSRILVTHGIVMDHVKSCIEKGIESGTHYKEIYKICKVELGPLKKILVPQNRLGPIEASK